MYFFVKTEKFIQHHIWESDLRNDIVWNWSLRAWKGWWEVNQAGVCEAVGSQAFSAQLWP